MSSSSSLSTIKKSRNRIPVSCQECRKRKMKCDKGKPCSSCVKNDCVDLCTYVKDSIEPSSKVTPRKANLKNELLKLKMKVNQMETIMRSHNIDITKFNDEDTLFNKVTNTGNQQDEEMSSLLKKFDTMIVKENNTWRSGLMGCWALTAKDEEISSLVKPLAEHAELQYTQYLEIQKGKISDYPIDVNQAEILNANPVVACAFSDPGDDNAEFLRTLDEINQSLPPLYIINVLVDRFFKYVYHFLPYVREDVFREELSRVLISLPNGSVKVGVAHIQNASIISLLLLLLRFGFMSIQNDSDVAIPKDASFTISEKYRTLAKNLLYSIKGTESIEKKITFRVIQVLLLSYCHDISSSESIPSNMSTALEISKLITMARLAGIFRDPSNYENKFVKDKRQNDITRRIAFKLFLLDWQSAFHNNSHLLIFESELDVTMPQLTASQKEKLQKFKNGESLDCSLEELKTLMIETNINSDTTLEYETSLVIRKCFSILQCSNKGTYKKDLVDSLGELQRFADTKIPYMHDLIKKHCSVSLNQMSTMFGCSSVRVLLLRLSILQFFITTNYMLHLNDELNGYHDSEKFNNACVKTTEYSLQYLKFVHDYSYYIKRMKHGYYNDHNSVNNNVFHMFKTFSQNLDAFIFTFASRGFENALCWIGSVFYRSAKSKSLNLDMLIEKFSNNNDSTSVLQWFLSYNKWNSARSFNEQFPTLLFAFIKQYYISLSKLKNDFVDAVKNWFMIKVFVKSAMIYEKKTYDLYIKGEFGENTVQDTELSVCGVTEMLDKKDIEMSIDEKFASSDFKFDFFDQAPSDIDNFYQQIMQEVDLQKVDLTEIPFSSDISIPSITPLGSQFASPLDNQSSSAMSTNSYTPDKEPESKQQQVEFLTGKGDSFDLFRGLTPIIENHLNDVNKQIQGPELYNK